MMKGTESAPAIGMSLTSAVMITSPAGMRSDSTPAGMSVSLTSELFGWSSISKSPCVATRTSSANCRRLAPWNVSAA